MAEDEVVGWHHQLSYRESEQTPGDSEGGKPDGLQSRPPFHHQLPEFTQTHVHLVDDAIQPSHPLSSPSPPTKIFP